jgi:hypothetical protein
VRRPLVSDNAHTLKLRTIRHLPIIEHVIDDSVETFG